MAPISGAAIWAVPMPVARTWEKVMSPSGIQFQPGLDANAYVARAGGTTEVAVISLP